MQLWNLGIATLESRYCNSGAVCVLVGEIDHMTYQLEEQNTILKVNMASDTSCSDELEPLQPLGEWGPLQPLEAPCRAASRFLVDCPTCKKRIQIKTLRYSHYCDRSYDVTLRAEEQAKQARAVFLARTVKQSEKEQVVKQDNKKQTKYNVNSIFIDAFGPHP